MGYYINPPTGTKEEWLKENGIASDLKEGWTCVYNHLGYEDYLPVVLIDNGPFTAAGIAFSEREFEAFTIPEDKRKKTFWLVKIEDLCKGCNDFAGYWKKVGKKVSN